MLLTLIACGPGQVDLEKDPPGGADPDTDPVQTDSESPPDDSGTPPLEALCGSLAGVVGEGTSWAWMPIYNTTYDVTREASVTSVEDDLVRVEDLIDYNYDSYTYHYVYEYLYRCDGNGLQLMASSTTYAYDYGGNDYSSESQIVYDEPVQILPADATLGDGWDASYVGTMTTNGHDSPYRMELTYSVIGEETVEVEYGEVEAIRILSEYNGQPYQTSYVGRGLGVVQDQQWELIDYSP